MDDEFEILLKYEFDRPCDKRRRTKRRQRKRRNRKNREKVKKNEAAFKIQVWWKFVNSV